MPLSPAQKQRCSELSETITDVRARLDALTADRHRYWMSLVDEGATHTEVAEASGVVRQAIGWAITHPPGE
jgi:hypothetical protein